MKKPKSIDPKVAKVPTEVVNPREITMDLPKDVFKPSEPKPSMKREVSRLAEETLGIMNDLAGNLPQNCQEEDSVPKVIPKVLLPVEGPKKEVSLCGHFVVVKRFVSFECGGVKLEFTPGRQYDVSDSVYRILKAEKVVA